jgi:hypothetical protein
MIKNPIPTAWQILMNSRWSAGSRRVWSACCGNVLDGGGRTLSAPADEEGSLADKVLGEVGELLDGFGHGGRAERGRREGGEERRESVQSRRESSDSRDNLAFRGPEHRVSPLRRCVQHQTELSLSLSLSSSSSPYLFPFSPSSPVLLLPFSLSPRSDYWARAVSFPGPRLSTSHDPCTIGTQSGASVFSRIDQLAWPFN